MWFLRLTACALCLLYPLTAAAVIETKSFDAAATGVNNVGLNVSRTLTLALPGYNQATVYIKLTKASATALNMTCEGTWDAARTVSGPISMVDVSATTSTITNKDPTTWTVSTAAQSAAATRIYRFNILPINDAALVCVLTGTGAASGDLVTVYARAGVM